MDIWEELKEEHQALEDSLRRLKQAVTDDDPTALHAAWRQLESGLVEHMRFEEDGLLPSFADENPEESLGLRVEHQQIRSALEELGLAVQLHELRASSIDSFVDKVRSHVRREEGALYQWAARRHAAYERGPHTPREVIDEMRLQLHLLSRSSREATAIHVLRRSGRRK